MITRLTRAYAPDLLHPYLRQINSLLAAYIRVMQIKRHREHLNLFWRALGYLYVAWAYARDVWFNLVTASRIFRELPRELTVTARLKRLRKTGTPEQQAVAEFLCERVLDAHDPDGDHC